MTMQTHHTSSCSVPSLSEVSAWPPTAPASCICWRTAWACAWAAAMFSTPVLGPDVACDGVASPATRCADSDACGSLPDAVVSPPAPVLLAASADWTVWAKVLSIPRSSADTADPSSPSRCRRASKAAAMSAVGSCGSHAARAGSNGSGTEEALERARASAA